MLDNFRLENLRPGGGGRTRARCPACAADGADTKGDHLLIDTEGRFGCAMHPGDEGRDHRKRVFSLVGVKAERSLAPVVRRAAVNPQGQPFGVQLPVLELPTVSELSDLQLLRGLPTFAGLQLAVYAGLLRCATMCDRNERVRAWILLDSSRRCAQARRLDGKPWSCIGDKKAMTLRGSQAAWPIGAADIGDKPRVALCEGGPDTLAAWTLSWWHDHVLEVAPVCMCGSHAMHPDALPYFRGKGIFLIPHRDDRGASAAGTWTAQLRDAGARWVRPYDLSPHKDLNDALTAAARETDDSR